MPEREEGLCRDHILHEIPRKMNVILKSFGLPTLKVLIWFTFIALFVIFANHTKDWTMSQYVMAGGVILMIILAVEGFDTYKQVIYDEKYKVTNPPQFPHTEVGDTSQPTEPLPQW